MHFRLGDVPWAQRTFWKRFLSEVFGWDNARIEGPDGQYQRKSVEDSLHQEAERYRALGMNDGFAGYFAGRPDVLAQYAAEYGGSAPAYPFAEVVQTSPGTWQSWHRRRADILAAEGYSPGTSSGGAGASFGAGSGVFVPGPVTPSAPAPAPSAPASAPSAPGYGSVYAIPGSSGGGAAPAPAPAPASDFTVAPFPGYGTGSGGNAPPSNSAQPSIPWGLILAALVATQI